MNYREYRMADKAALNANAYERLCDKLGVKQFHFIGMKNRRSTQVEDIVFQEPKERFVCSVVGSPGIGKSVLAAQIGDFAHFCQGKPLVVNDRKREWHTHHNALEPHFFSKQLSAFGFYPTGINLQILKPKFAGMLEPGVDFAVTFQALRELDEEVAEGVFSRFMNLQADGSPSYRDMVAWAWGRVKDPARLVCDLQTLMHECEGENKRRSQNRQPVAGGFYSNLDFLKRADAITFEGLDVAKQLLENKAVAMLSTTNPLGRDPRFFLFDAYEAYFAGLRYTLRKQKRLPSFVCIEEEFETSIQQNEYAASRLDLQVTKQAVYRNDLVVVTQDPADVPAKMLKFSDVVLSANLGGALRFGNQESAAGLLASETAHLKSGARPAEWRAFYADGHAEDFVPTGGFSSYLKRV